jgi:hypothetical protein
LPTINNDSSWQANDHVPFSASPFPLFSAFSFPITLGTQVAQESPVPGVSPDDAGDIGSRDGHRLGTWNVRVARFLIFVPLF